MSSLNPQWLAIEIQMIDETVRGFGEAFMDNYQAAFKGVGSEQGTNQFHDYRGDACDLGDGSNC